MGVFTMWATRMHTLLQQARKCDPGPRSAGRRPRFICCPPEAGLRVCLPRGVEEHWSAPLASTFYQHVAHIMHHCTPNAALVLCSTEWQSPGDLLAEALTSYGVDVNRTTFVYGGQMHPAWPHETWPPPSTNMTALWRRRQLGSESW